MKLPLKLPMVCTGVYLSKFTSSKNLVQLNGTESLFHCHWDSMERIKISHAGVNAVDLTHNLRSY